jgi:hypothetical protein
MSIQLGDGFDFRGNWARETLATTPWQKNTIAPSLYRLTFLVFNSQLETLKNGCGD